MPSVQEVSEVAVTCGRQGSGPSPTCWVMHFFFQISLVSPSRYICDTLPYHGKWPYTFKAVSVWKSSLQERCWHCDRKGLQENSSGEHPGWKHMGCKKSLWKLNLFSLQRRREGFAICDHLEKQRLYVARLLCRMHSEATRSNHHKSWWGKLTECKKKSN